MHAIILLSTFFQSPIDQLDALAKSRNVDGILEMADGRIQAGDLRFLRSSGAFGVGSKGWRAELLLDKDGGRQYVVFTTLLTTQDYGDQVFEWSNGKLGAKINEKEAWGHLIRHLHMDIAFPLPKTARLTTTAVCEVRDPSKPALFRLGGNYKVSSVKSETGQNLAFSQAGGVVMFRAPEQSQPGGFSLTGDRALKGRAEQIKNKSVFTLTYEGVVDNPGYAGAITENEVMLTNDYWWPSTARYPLTFTANVHTPESWDVMTNGERGEATIKNGVKTTTYRMDMPIVYLSLSAGVFRKAEAKVGDITYRIWSTKLPEDQLKLQTELFPSVLEFYSRAFGKHPFSQYGAVDTELYGGGALEAYSYATYGHGWLPDDDAHEPCHTWFGGVLANNYLTSMWNESFASWCEGLYQRENEIGSKADKRRAFVGVPGFNSGWNSTTQVDSGVDWAGVSSTLGYGRGGDVLQQLEFEMGTEEMLDAVRKWIREQPAGEPAEWEGFMAACGPQWAWFFDQWHRRPGAPRFTLSDVVRKGAALSGKVVFEGAAYKMKTEVAYRTPAGWTLGAVTLDGSGSFSAACPADASEVIFDPFGRLPMQHKRAEQPSWRQAARMPVVLDEKRADWMPERARKADWDGTTRNGFVFVGHPATSPVVAELCVKAGFVVSGDKLTYRGHTIDLNRGSAVALIDLGNGQRCGLRLGKSRRGPNVGSARAAITDDLGRFIAGETEPRREEGFVFGL